ncbi:MAG: UDP-N-acetylmuramoyl-L-alanyl-D-glutamate--2,6-diaminopimelate ligase [Balneolales bacterium]
MNVTDLLHITRPLQKRGKYEGKLGRLVLDSRTVRKNDVFIALRGEKSDGHHFIGDAVRKGAMVIIAEQIPGEKSKNGQSPEAVLPEDRLIIQVANTMNIVGELAQNFAGYPAESMKMIGVTGTNGKTTVSTLVYQVLKSLGYNAGLLSTVDTRIGDRIEESRLTTPDAVTLASLLNEMSNVDTAFAVMEVSSHALEQQRVGGIRFDVAAFTNISQDHLDYHRDMDAYINAKRRLFLSLDREAVAVVNRDDPAYVRITEGCHAEIWEFGFQDDKDFRILDEGPEGMVLDLDGMIVSTPLAGRYNAYNVAQAYLICLAAGCSKYNVAAALGDTYGAPGRMERVVLEKSAGPVSHKSTMPSVFVDYAHTPDALDHVLQALHEARRKGQMLHVVFGCGGDRDRTKRSKMGHIADQYADVITLTSDNPRTEDPQSIIRDIREGITRNDHLFIEPDRRKAIRAAILDADTRTMVLVAGKGHENYQEVHGRRKKFDDRKVVAGALSEWVDRRLPGKNSPGGADKKITGGLNRNKKKRVN